jgi:hypothetical protein
MPRYFFNIFSGGGIDHRDEVGEELPDRAAAWETATRYAADSLRDLDGKLRIDTDWRLEVVRDDASVVFQITVHADEFRK